jgi:hypothetical protein
MIPAPIRLVRVEGAGHDLRRADFAPIVAALLEGAA